MTKPAHNLRHWGGALRLVAPLLAIGLAGGPLQAGDRARSLLASLSGDERLLAGEPEAALARYDEAIGLDPELAAAHRGRGLALARLDRREDAIAALETAVRLAPEDGAAHLDLALLYLGEGDLFWAGDEIVVAAELRPDDPVVAYYEGRVLYELGDVDAAAEAFQRALDGGGPRDAAGFYHGIIGLVQDPEAGFSELRRVAALDEQTAYTRAAAELSQEMVQARWDVPPVWSALLGVSGHYDSNVIFEPIEVAAPLGKSAAGVRLRGAVAAAPFSTPAHLVSARLALARTTHFADPPAQLNETTGALSAAYRHRFAVGADTHAAGIGISYEVGWLDGGAIADRPDFYAYRESVATALEYEIEVEERYRVILELRHRHAVFADMRRDAESFGLRLAETLMLAQGRLKLLMAVGLRYDDARGRGFDLWGGSASLGLSSLLPWALEARGLMSAIHQNHFDSGYYSGWGAGRIDDVLIIDLGLARPLWGPLEVAAGYSHTLHGSIAPTYDYRRGLTTLGVTARWP